MVDAQPPTPKTYGLMTALFLQGVSGVMGGFGLVGDPSGESIRIPASWLDGSPFNDYLIPGLIHLLLLGLVPLITLHGLWRGRSWGNVAALGIGVALVVWIGVQILIIGYQAWPPLQLSYGTLGIVITVLAWRSWMLPATGGRSGIGTRVKDRSPVFLLSNTYDPNVVLPFCGRSTHHFGPSHSDPCRGGSGNWAALVPRHRAAQRNERKR